MGSVIGQSFQPIVDHSVWPAQSTWTKMLPVCHSRGPTFWGFWQVTIYFLMPNMNMSIKLKSSIVLKLSRSKITNFSCSIHLKKAFYQYGIRCWSHTLFKSWINSWINYMHSHSYCVVLNKLYRYWLNYELSNSAQVCVHKITKTEFNRGHACVSNVGLLSRYKSTL
jgi:hypothetical protein